MAWDVKKKNQKIVGRVWERVESRDLSLAKLLGEDQWVSVSDTP